MELTFNRTNRRQNTLEFTACNPGTGSCRVVVREEWSASWVRNNPQKTFLADNKRFLWVSERSGFANIYLYDIGGKLLGAVTNHPFEVDQVVKVEFEWGKPVDPETIEEALKANPAKVFAFVHAETSTASSGEARSISTSLVLSSSASGITL